MKQKCRMCGSTKFKKIIDFGKYPLVNSLVNEEDFGKKEKVYPLLVKQCQKCFLVQLDNPINANKIYRDVDYLYFSSDIPQVKEYFAEYANDVKERFLEPSDFVLELASNDGVLLKQFNGWEKLGVDPASNVVIRAIKENIPTLSDFFGERLAKSIYREFGKAKVIMGNNFIAHLDNLDDIIEGIKILLDDNGVLILECNYWGNMVKNKNYALIYHDHYSYFTLENWIMYLRKFGMKVFDAVITPAQGGSLRLFACFNGATYQETERYKDIRREEITSGLNTYKTAKQHAENIKAEAKKLSKIVNDLKAKGAKIAGYGAAAKGFPVMKLANINQRHIDYFVDDSPAKQGKYTPVTHIPVISRETSKDQEPDYFFITASNYEESILAKEQEFLEKGGKFLTVDGRIIEK